MKIRSAESSLILLPTSRKSQLKSLICFGSGSPFTLKSARSRRFWLMSSEAARGAQVLSLGNVIAQF